MFATGTMPLWQFTALVGLHGAGKSYLISMIDSALPGWQTMTNLPVEIDAPAEHASGTRGKYVISICRGGEVVEVAVQRPLPWRERAASADANRPLVATLLTSYVASSELSFVADNWSPGNIPLPTELERLGRKELDVLGQITGHVYDWLECGVIDRDDAYFPFVRGERDSRPITSWSMSSSEFWVHYVLWFLRTAGADDVILIDEPETSLAERGHQAFVDEIARATLATGCQTVVATHSEAMIRRIPSECVLLLTSAPGGSEARRVSGVQSVLRALSRRRTTPTLMIFAEDRLGVRIGRAALLRFAPERADEVDFVDSGGKDEARHAARLVGRSARIAAVALLDGDERAGATGAELFLPGHQPPEVELLRALRRDAARAATLLHVTQSDLLAALDTTRFDYHQAQFREVADSLGGRSRTDVEETAIAIWLSLPDITSAAEELARQVIARLRTAET